MEFVSNNIELTGLTKVDDEDIVMYMQDKEISDGTSRLPFPYTLEDAKLWIEDNLAFESENGFIRNYAIRNETGKLLGCIGLHFNYGNDAAKSEFGYWLGKPYRNRGIMTEAIIKMMKLSKQQYKLNSLEAHVFEFNIASQKALIKAGFVLKQTIPDFYQKDGQGISALKFVKEL
jgi:ribosomal-protein-alanine N-acetyltransferase